MFVANGTSAVNSVTNTNSPQSVSLSGVDPETGVIRVQVATAGCYIDFGSGRINLQPNLPEFFQPPIGATSVSVGNTSATATGVCVTIGQEA